FLECFRLQVNQTDESRWLPVWLASVMQKFLSGYGERVNRNDVFFQKPKQDCTFELASSRIHSTYQYESLFLSSWVLFGFLGAHFPVALATTVALLVFVLVMVRQCWNAPPVPATRLWALAFGGMSAGMLYQFWRAEAWKTETEKLELKLQGRRLLPRRQVLPKTTSLSRDQRLLGVGARFAPRFAAIQFPALIIPCGLGTMSLADHLKGMAVWQTDVRSTIVAPEARDLLAYLAPFPLSSFGAHEYALAPSLYVNELHPSNRGLLIEAWQNATLTKRLWMKSRERPNPSQLKARSFWNPKSLNASYARSKRKLSPSLKPFGEQP